MQLSIIILNYNVRYFLEQCVLSVQRALENIDGEIIVIDNASFDASCEMMKTKFPHIKLIENQDNLGFPKGNNIGVAQAKGEYICILNPDTVVEEDTFSKY
jgi:GT2 family glycosyltransferase